MRRTIVSRTALVGVLVLGLYLSWAHWFHATVACPATGLIDCTAVLTGPGSVVIGLPLALWGAVWASAGLIVIGTLSPTWLTRLWQGLGCAGLLWAWSHEWADGHVCLWCSAVQLGVLLAIGVSIHWKDSAKRWRHGWTAISQPAWRMALGSGLLSFGTFLGYQVWLGTDTWGVLIVLGILWGSATMWLTALVLSRSRARRWPSAVGSVGGVIPLTVLTGVGATACASGLCTTGVGTVAAMSSAGLGGLLTATFGAFAPLALQGILAGVVVVASAAWTWRRGLSR